MLATEPAVEASTCPRCRTVIASGDTRCQTCGASLAAGVAGLTGSLPPPTNRPGWIAWGIGGGLGLLATLLPLTGYMSWFIASLCHEMGHSAMAMLTGSVAVPAIRLDGHAVAQMSDPLPFARLAIWAAVAWWAWRLRQRGAPGWKLVAGAALLYPLLAWPAREVAILYAGQFGELLFAGVFLWRAWTGGFTESPTERPLYATLGWSLIARNLILSWGLITSPERRATYWENGSFGLTNDLIRIALDHLGIALSTAAVPLLLGAIATPLLAWWAGRWWLRRATR